MTEGKSKSPGRLAQAVVTARIAAAALAPLGGQSGPVPQGVPPQPRREAENSMVSPAEKQLAQVQKDESRQRRAKASDLGSALKRPDVVLDGTKRAPRRRAR